MQQGLPGSESSAAITRSMAQSVARVLGREDLIQLVSDITSIKKTRIPALISKAVEGLTSFEQHEYRAVSADDKDWIENALGDAYGRLAVEYPREFVVQSLLGAERLSLMISDLGLTDEALSTLASLDTGAQNYSRRLNHHVASLIVDWYQSNPQGQRVSSSVGISEALRASAATREELTEIRLVLEELGGRQLRVNPAVILDQLLSKMVEVIERAPEYYPAEFNNQGLGRVLQLYDLKDERFHRYESQGLYWNEKFYGDRTSGSVVSSPGKVNVLLGNPGSGKSTLLKSLVLTEIAADRRALYCRLEDLSFVSDSNPGINGLSAVLLATSRTVGLSLDIAQANLVAEAWRLGKTPSLVALDGLDEVATAEGYASSRQVAAQLAGEGNAVIVSSRVAGYTTPWSDVSKHYAVAPLWSHEQDAFAARWFESSGSKKAARRFSDAKERRQLTDILENPLTLGFVCMIAHYEQVPESPAAVYDRFLEHFLRAPWRSPSQRRIAPARVAELREKAGRISWEMSQLKREGITRWADSATLMEIATTTGDANSLEVYETGLLIPHGHLEAKGDTHQEVRWLHRTIQENLVANELRRQIEMDHGGWKKLVNRAVLLPAWQEALNQCFELLTPHILDNLVDHLINTAEHGDTPGSDFTHAAGAAAAFSKSPEVRQRVARRYARESRWGQALELSVEATLAELASELYKGYLPNGDFIWSKLVQRVAESDQPERLSVLVPFSARCPELRKQLHILRILQTNDTLGLTHLAKLVCDEARSARFPLSLSPSQMEILSNSFEYELERLNRHHKIPSLEAARQTLGGVLGEEPAPRDPCSRLNIALMDYFLIPHDPQRISKIRYFYDGEEAPFMAYHLRRNGIFSFPMNKDARAIGEHHFICFDCDGIPELEPPVLPVSDLSQGLALAIIRRLGYKKKVDRNQEERLEWALNVLCSAPTIEAIPLLADLMVTSHSNLDNNLLINAINRQPWELFQQQDFSKVQRGTFWKGLAFLVSAITGLSRSCSSVTISTEQAIDRFLEGVRLLCCHSLSVKEIEIINHFSFEGIPPEAAERFASVLVQSSSLRAAPFGFHVLYELYFVIRTHGTLPSHPGLLGDYVSDIRTQRRDGEFFW